MTKTEEIKNEVAKQLGWRDFLHIKITAIDIDYEKDIDSLIEGVAKLYYKRLLEEAGKELPSITDLQNEFMNYPNRTQMVSEIMLKLEQASLLLASQKEEMEGKDIVIANVNELAVKKNNEIAQLKGEIAELKKDLFKYDRFYSTKKIKG